MKFLISISFLLLAAAGCINASRFIAEGPAADGPTSPEPPTPLPIFDITGAPLKFDVPYYMSASMAVWGGGVVLAPPSQTDICPKAIQLSPAVAERGSPVVFTSAIPNVTGEVIVGSELIVNFYNLTRPNDEFCGGTNLTTWVTTRTWSLAVGGEEMTTVFRFSLGDLPYSYVLKPVTPLKIDLVVGLDAGRNLVVQVPDIKIDLSFVFQTAAAKEEEDDKPVIVQILRKMGMRFWST